MPSPMAAPRSRSATVAILVVATLVVLVLVGVLYFWVTATQLRPMP